MGVAKSRTTQISSSTVARRNCMSAYDSRVRAGRNHLGHYRHLIRARCGPTHFRKISSCIGNTFVKAIRSGFTVFEREIPLCLPGAVLQSAALLNARAEDEPLPFSAPVGRGGEPGRKVNVGSLAEPRRRANAPAKGAEASCEKSAGLSSTLPADPRTEYSDRECTRDFGGAALAPPI
jgi:hypothetical protein